MGKEWGGMCVCVYGRRRAGREEEEKGGAGEGGGEEEEEEKKPGKAFCLILNIFGLIQY